MSPALKPVVRNSAKLSSGIAPLGQSCSSTGIRRVVVQGHSLAYDPVLHPVRDGGESSSITRPTEVADHAVGSSVCLEDWHRLARAALRLTGCISVDGIGIRASKRS